MRNSITHAPVANITHKRVTNCESVHGCRCRTGNENRLSDRAWYAYLCLRGLSFSTLCTRTYCTRGSRLTVPPRLRKRSLPASINRASINNNIPSEQTNQSSPTLVFFFRFPIFQTPLHFMMLCPSRMCWTICPAAYPFDVLRLF